jgi:hypothetical protein
VGLREKGSAGGSATVTELAGGAIGRATGAATGLGCGGATDGGGAPAAAVGVVLVAVGAVAVEADGARRIVRPAEGGGVIRSGGTAWSGAG